MTRPAPASTAVHTPDHTPDHTPYYTPCHTPAHDAPRRPRRSFSTGPAALVLSLLALVVALSGTSYAAVQLAKGSVGTAQLKNNAVTSAKVKNASLKAGDFAPGQLPAGPTGPTGATGATGAPGTPGTPGAPGMVRGWAQINADGTVARSGGQFPVTSADVNKVGTGSYNITAPGWGTASSPQTVFAALSGGGAGQITAYPAAVFLGSSFPAEVTTFNAGGTLTDRNFTVLLP